MNYFLETTSESISLRQRTSEYTSKHVCSFQPDQALAAIVCCQALNSNCLSQTLATQEMEQPGTQDWLALRDQEDKAANSEFRAEYGSDDDDLKPSDYGYCDQCGENLPTGYQDYCSTQCLDKAHPGNGEVELPAYTCKNCSEVVPEGHQYCCGQCYEADDRGVEVAPSTHSCTHCDNQVGPGIGLCHQCYMAMQPM